MYHVETTERKTKPWQVQKMVSKWNIDLIDLLRHSAKGFANIGKQQTVQQIMCFAFKNHRWLINIGGKWQGTPKCIQNRCCSLHMRLSWIIMKLRATFGCFCVIQNVNRRLRLRKVVYFFFVFCFLFCSISCTIHPLFTFVWLWRWQKAKQQTN